MAVSRPSGSAVAATVADDTTVSATVPGGGPAHAGGSAPTKGGVAPSAPPVTPPPPSVRVSAAPVTTTTLGRPPATGAGVVTHGIATYYAHPAGRCASPWIPFGTTVWITNPANGKSVSCVVDDYETDTARSVDLATATFAEIAPLTQGVVDAELSW